MGSGRDVHGPLIVLSGRGTVNGLIGGPSEKLWWKRTAWWHSAPASLLSFVICKAWLEGIVASAWTNLMSYPIVTTLFVIWSRLCEQSTMPEKRGSANNACFEINNICLNLLFDNNQHFHASCTVRNQCSLFVSLKHGATRCTPLFFQWHYSRFAMVDWKRDCRLVYFLLLDSVWFCCVQKLNFFLSGQGWCSSQA